MPKNTLSFSDPFVETITIDQGLTPDQPKVTKENKDIRTCVRGPVVWFIVNNDTTSGHTVTIDYGKIKHKNNGVKEHPFPGGKNGNSTDVDAATSVNTPKCAAIVEVIKKYTPSYNPDEYTYTVEVTTPHSTNTVSVDPDLDVVDPFPFQFRKKQRARRPQPKTRSARSKSSRRKR